MKATTKPSRTRYSGNALMEYVLPAAIIMLSSGLLITVIGSTNIMTNYYISASGRAVNAGNPKNVVLKDKTFITQGLADRANGNASNGLPAFGNSSFADLIDGAGSILVSNQGGRFYLGDMTRKTSRPISSSPDYLYPSQP